MSLMAQTKLIITSLHDSFFVKIVFMLMQRFFKKIFITLITSQICCDVWRYYVVLLNVKMYIQLTITLQFTVMFGGTQ